MKKIRILIIDDHQLILDGLKALIKDVPEFFCAGEANSGNEALKLARSSVFDIVLMDIEMDGINGIETTRLLLEEHPAAKILALTMYNEKGMINRALEAGASGYVLKNVNKEELIEAIKKIVSGEKYFSAEVVATLLEKTSTKIITSKETSDLDNLTKREIEVLKLIAQGLSNREAGEKLFISPRTVDTHRTNMMEKLQIKNIAGLIRYAIQHSYLE
jgi:DNA-binding NarL/FixJ family response regulator